MKAFRFRAQPALDLRQREFEVAQRDLARAEQVRDAARQRLREADEAATQARVQAGDAHRTSTSVTGLEWYRFWILRLDHERTAQSAIVAVREADVLKAHARCIRAHQRRDALERFKDKARAAYDEAERASEMKLIDELATRRFTAARQA